MEYLQRNVRKLLIGIAGGLVLLIGLVLIPHPGPGWLIVFFGLTILATEFMWAQGVLDALRSRYEQWQERIQKQSAFVQALFWLLTAVAVIITIWLFNGYGVLNAWFGLELDWLASPFVQIEETP